MRYAKNKCNLSSDGTTLAISGPCIKCRVTQTVRILHDQYDKYERGSMIQEAFPDLSVGEREFLMSGYCSPCFDALCDKLENKG